MNIVNEFRRDEGRILDRLVDGELSQDQRRELLAALDDEPGAWRRCALAFLEAQTWRWQLSQRAAEPLVAQAATSAPAAPRNATRSRWGVSLAIAASLFVAFVLGVRYQSAGQRLEPDNVARSAPRLDEAEPVALAQTDGGPAAGAAQSDGEQEETISLTLADGADDESEIQLPVTSAGEDDSDWAQNESALPLELLQSLQQAGLEVNRQYRFMPIDLSDGRRLVVPIEEIEIHDPELAQYQ